MKSRLLCAATAVAMLLGIIPLGLFSVSAENTTAVEYIRLEPEVAILNAFTAADSNFYEKLKGACRGEGGASPTPYPSYNGMSELFWMQSGMWSAHPSFLEDTGMTSSFTWSPLERDGYETPTFEKSTLKRLMQTFDNLAVKVSGEFQNYTHKHTFWKGAIPYEREVTNYLTATLDISGNQSIPVRGLDGIGVDNYRDGDDNSYLPIFYHEDNNEVSLNFTKAKIDYYNGKYCTCNGANANHMLITFRDKRAPQLTSVSYSNNGTSWRDRYSSSGNWQLGAGDDLYIKLSFDEPIRFSDDNAKGKNSLKIGLKLAGKSVRDDMYANLYKLDTDALYFKYTVPDNMVLDEDIISLDLSSLFGNDLNLVQMQRVYNYGHFTIENDVLKELGITDTYGFNTTDCYVTDIAGNALVRGDISNPRLHIDTNAPEIEAIDFGAVYNNDDVNKALGDDGELNPSGLYLGEGDSINMKLVMSEPLDLTLPETAEGYYRMDWKYAKVKTNIYKKDGTQVVVKSRWFTPSTPNKYLNTKTTFVMESIPIEEGMYVDTTDNPDGEVRVESVDMSEYGKQITDLKGNAISLSNVKIKLGAGSNPPKLDTTRPTVQEGDYIQAGDGFRQQVNIVDKETGVSDIYGEFVLTQAGDSNSYKYQWAVSAEADATNLEWKQGKTGVAQEFKQKETTWIHIKPDDSTQYDNLDQCTLTVYAKDLAGNTGVLTMGSDKILWYVDNRAPKATAGETRKVINGDTGTLEADIVFDDSHQISAWEYAWSSDNTNEPTAWIQGGGITEGYTETSLIVTASADVTAGNKFEGYLWVRATDNSKTKNQSEAACIGKYAYDLTVTKYALSYSKAVTEKASLKVSRLDAGDALVFMIPVQNTENQYSVLRVTVDNFAADKNIFEMDGWENWYVSENGGIYTMTAKSDHSISSVINGAYAGNLEVQVLSGKTAGLVGVGGSPWSAGGDGYTFSMSEKINLRLASNNPWKNYSILDSEPNPADYIKLTTTASTGLGNTKQIWDGTQTLHSTLAGCEFDITIDQDRFGWNGDDIDCRKSKLVVTNITEGTTKEIPLTGFSENTENNTWSQKIIVSGDYTSGVYTAVLKLVSVTGAEAEIPITGSARTIVVDATEPNENLTLNSIINDRFSLGSYTAYGVEDFYPERECIKEGKSVIELPIGAGYFDRSRNQSWAQSSELYKLTFTSENEPNRQSLTDEAGNLYSYIGQYYVEVWTEDNPDKKVKFNTESTEQTTITNRNYRVIDGEGWDANGFSILDKDKDDPNFVYLAPDTENKVYFRKVYANRRTTQTQSVFIKPVNEQLKGTMSLDKENKKLVFTPTTGEETSIGATVYAFAYQNGQDYTKGEGERIAMDYYGGVWTCDLKDNGAIYRVVTINSHGSIWASEEDDEIRQLAPYLAAEPTYTDNGDGTYRLEVSLYDDYDTIKKEGLMLSVGFNSDYATEPYKLEVTKELFDEYNPNTYIETIKGYSKNGIYRAEVSVSPGWQNANDYLTLTIDGVMMKKNSDSPEEQPMQITVTAVDAYGNRIETSTDNKTVQYKAPKIIAHELTQDGLKLTFSHPVVPTNSWAWQESAQKEVICQREWAGAFPVAANGTYDIEFRDVFGNICTDELITEDFTKDGIDWSLDLTFSETEFTKDAILFTAEMPNNDDIKTGVLIYDKPTITTLVPEGNYNGYPHTGNSWISFDPNKPWNEDTRYAPSSPRTVKLEKNTELRVFVYNSTWVDNYNNNLIFGQPVYINNIANEAPTAKVYYYHPMIGSDMSYEQLEQYIAKRGGSLKLEGSMQVTYKTSRSVTPTNDSGSVFFFTPENYTTSHTFSYIDDMSHSGSVTVSLPDGLELVEPAVPYEDKTSPSVKAALSAKTNGSYTEMESFIAGETQEQLKEKVLNMDTAQGYSLKVNAQDESGYTMTVTEADGVSVMGNMILVDKPSAFTVTVTDKSENKNETSFSMTADMFEKMDNIPPTAEIDTQPVSMYEKKLVVQLRDTNNKGEDTTKDEGGNDLESVTLISPSDAVKVGPNKYEYNVKENGKVDFVFRDRAGNRNAGEGASAMVSGIDTDPPKLKLTWAPPLSYFDDEINQTVIDFSQPTWELVGTDVTAFVDSDKAMYKLTIAWGGQNPVTLLEKGMPTENNPYVIADAEKTIVTVSATTERITLVYAEGFGQSLDFTAYAANGKSSEIDVQAWLNIDKITPQITAVQENLYRQKDGGGAYSVPYGVKVTFTPDEWVFSDNYGGTEIVDYGNGPTEEYKYFSYDEPLVLTFTENGNYNVRFSDEAGNVTVESVTISGIDRTEPKITLGELSGGGQSASIPITVDKDCTVSVDGRELVFTAGVEQTIIFSNNGNYTIVATDSAGNKDERVVTVGSIDRIVPSISFTTGTIYVLQNGDVDEYNNQLHSGYTVWDNKTAVEDLTVNFDASAVKLDTAGMYTVVYTVTDEVGNVNQTNRFVQVIGEDTTCICIDGILVMPDSTAVIKPGTHTLTLKNGNEPYSIKARKGIRTSGQMKYLKSSSLSFDENGEFAVNNEGYYTVQVTTQSRKVIRIKLYVEQ